MSSSQAPSSSYFEQQRAELLREISLSFEQVLQNINRLNRNLESVIAVGNEFSSVEALWSQFENVMAKNDQGNGEHEHGEEAAEGLDKAREASEAQENESVTEQKNHEDESTD